MRTEAAGHNANDDNVVDGQRDDDDDNDNYDNDESGTRETCPLSRRVNWSWETSPECRPAVAKSSRSL